MMSSTACVRLVLSSAPSHSVSSNTTSRCTVVVPDEWSIAQALCCSCTVAASLNVLSAQNC
jgi:hypothetical protein